MAKAYTLAELAEQLSANLDGDPQAVISGVAPLADATSSALSFFNDPRYQSALGTTKAGVVLLTQAWRDKCSRPCLIVKDPYFSYAQVAALFDRSPAPKPGIHPTAVIGNDCEIAPSASIGPYCVLGDGVSLAEGVTLEAHCHISDRSRLGRMTHLKPHVTIYHDVIIGEAVLIHAGAIIGSDGFGNARDVQGRWLKIAQLGSVKIGDRVEIGANTTIDRGTLEDTIIANGVRLDNLIQIAHNVQIGENTAIAACVGIAGSTKIGKNCMIAGQTGINGHITICDNTLITGMSMVTKSITKPGIYSSGTGLLPNKVWRRCAVRFRQLDEIVRRFAVNSSMPDDK